MDNIKKIQVVFALDDPYQLQQYKHAYNRKNSSGYMKNLIQRDIEMNSITRPSVLVSEHQIVEPNKMIPQKEEEPISLDFSVNGFI